MSVEFKDAMGAVFSDCRCYRYSLWRNWDVKKPRLLFIMLNPSTADETKNDPTIARCMTRAVRMDFGSLEVVNLFALRSTDPLALGLHPSPIGATPMHNDSVIIRAAKAAGMVICGWGKHGSNLGRGKEVTDMLRSAGFKLHYLSLNIDGSPKHPLYVNYKTRPKEWLE